MSKSALGMTLWLTEALGNDQGPIVMPLQQAFHHPAFDCSAYPDENTGIGEMQQ